MFDQFPGIDWPTPYGVMLALAGSHAGEGAVDRYGGIPPYRETRNDVRRVQVTHAALGWILARKLARTGQPAGE